jgi:hypothetical protein
MECRNEASSKEEVSTALNKIRNGPVKPNIKASSKLGQRLDEVKIHPQVKRPQSSGQIESRPKPKPQVNRAKPRPASPGIRGKVAEVPYKAYANTLKST